jgi:hypothetical protein
MLFLDGVYVERTDRSLHFRWVKAPTSAELTGLTRTLALCIGQHLERQGLMFAMRGRSAAPAGPLRRLEDAHGGRRKNSSGRQESREDGHLSQM